MGRVPLTAMLLHYRRWLLPALVLALAGCGTTRVAVDEPVPQPVMEKVPLHAGLVLLPELVSLVHEPENSDWIIDLGAGNAALFRNLLAGMFVEVSELSDVAAGGVDVVLRPSLISFQLSTPDEGATAFFESWIRYEVSIHAPDGRRLSRIPVSAYGRSPDRLLGDDQALNDAVAQALRDAATALVVALPRNAALETRVDPSTADGDGASEASAP